MFDYVLSHYVYGTTVESNIEYDIHKASSISDRFLGMRLIKNLDVKTFVTIEPRLDFELSPFVEQLKECKPDWINIGADSKKHGLKEPMAISIEQLICELKRFTEVRIKENLYRLISKERLDYLLKTH
jgi:hypothetical protein